MTDNQYYAHQWLSRMWYIDIEIEQLIVRREAIVSSMSGIGKYDAEHIPTQNGENATESKNIEYSIINGQIDKKLSDLSNENIMNTKRKVLFQKFVFPGEINTIHEKYLIFKQ